MASGKLHSWTHLTEFRIILFHHINWSRTNTYLAFSVLQEFFKQASKVTQNNLVFYFLCGKILRKLFFIFRDNEKNIQVFFFEVPARRCNTISNSKFLRCVILISKDFNIIFLHKYSLKTMLCCLQLFG